MLSDGDADASREQSAGEKAQDAKDKAQEAAAPAAEKAQEVKGKAQEAVAPAKEKVQAVAGEAKGHAQAAAEQAKGQAAAQVDVRSTQVGQQIGSQGAALEGVAGELRDQGKDGAARVAEQAAEKVKNVGEYLEQADGEKLVGAAQQVARDNPAAAAAVGAAAGFAAGRVIKAALDEGDEEPAGEPGAPESGAA
jgi:ElaB/YqjD/DUF883 family membrane-anchored ribosome-binding protein